MGNKNNTARHCGKGINPRSFNEAGVFDFQLKVLAIQCSSAVTANELA